MKIWMDGDACPQPIKAILYRAAMRAQISLTVVANQLLHTPPSSWIRAVQVQKGFDVADNYIVHFMSEGDLVITADIPLADDVVTRGGLALNPRGELYSANNIKQRLQARDQNEVLRGAGIETRGPEKFGPKDLQRFANNLDTLIRQRHLKKT